MKEVLNNIRWRDILSNIEKEITEVSFRTWIQPLVPIAYNEDTSTVTLACTEDFKVEVIKQRYIPIIEKAINKVLNKPAKAIVCSKSEDEIEEILNSSPESSDVTTAATPDTSVFKEEYYFNPRYTFENFVVGSNNNYAHAVALAVAENPAKTYNPLFIYGGSGLGKTHLMHAIGNKAIKDNSSVKALYVSSEMFTNELIEALRDHTSNSKINSFKQKYRNVDILLIDDIQFIEGKKAVQTEFFHTFNTLFELKKQIVISSDRHPSKLEDLDERLRTRFNWNIIADIQQPDFETRVAILRNKAELENIPLDDDLLEVIDLISEKVKFNIRELESALTRIISFSQVFNHKITVKFAKEKLTDIFSVSDIDISCESVKKAVCKAHNIRLADIESSKRNREFSYPRQIAMYLCRELTDLSFPKIGESFGKRDHTTVLHAYEKISNEIKTNPELAEEIKKLKESIQ